MNAEGTDHGSTLSAQQWYRKRADGQDGPWSPEHLLAEAAAGRVSPDDLVKTDAMPDWVAAKTIDGLTFPRKVAGPPPLPAVPPRLPVKQPPPLPKAPSKSVPPSPPPRRSRPAAKVRRSQPVIWGYVGAALILLTLGLGVAVVIVNEKERADMATLPTTPSSTESTAESELTKPTSSARPSTTTTTAPSPVSQSPKPPQQEREAKPEPPKPTPEEPKPVDSTLSILERLRGTRWENSNGVTFEWTADGKFLCRNVERPCREVGLYSVEVEFVAGVKKTLIFDEKLTKFDQYRTNGGFDPKDSGRRSNSSSARPPAPSPLAVGESAVLRGHEGYVWNVAFSQDNRQLLTLSQQGPVILWDVATRTKVWTANVTGDLRAVAFFDNERRIAVQKAGGLVILNTRSGEIEDESRFSANGWGKFSPDGRFLALKTVNDSKSRIHSVPSGRVLYEHPDRYVTAQRGYVFSRNGAVCYAGINDVYRLNLTTNPFPARTRIRQQNIEAMDASPDGKRLVTGSGRIWVDKLKKDIQGDNSVRVWDIASGRVVATLKGHDGWLWSVCFQPDGRRVLSAGAGRAEPLDFYGHRPGADTSLRLWDVATQRQLEKFEGHTAAVLDIKCSPDGRYAATGSADGTARLWRLPD